MNCGVPLALATTTSEVPAVKVPPVEKSLFEVPVRVIVAAWAVRVPPAVRLRNPVERA